MRNNNSMVMALGLILILSASLAAANSTTPANPEINWFTLDKGIEALNADTTGKHMFIHVTAAWCGWCRKMEAETYTDPEVIDYLNRHFIAVKLWSDSDSVREIEGYRISERQLAQGEFRVNGYPGFYFITPKKQKFTVPSGYKTKDMLMQILTIVQTREYEKQLEQQPQQPAPTPDNK